MTYHYGSVGTVNDNDNFPNISANFVMTNYVWSMYPSSILGYVLKCHIKRQLH